MNSRWQTDSRKLPQGLLSLLVVMVGAMGVLAITQGMQIYRARHAEPQEPDRVHWYLLAWSVLNALVAGYFALRHLLPRPTFDEPREQVPPVKLAVLIVGGLLGLFTVLLGLAFVTEWWDVLTGGREKWGKDWKPWAPVGMILAGLAVMFACLLSVRSEERASATLRRLIYGYNAVLTGLLVVAILGVFNVVTFFYGTQHLDFTATHIYTITDQTRRILQELPRPVRLIVVFPDDDPLQKDLITLFGNFMNAAPGNVEVGKVSPSFEELPRIAALARTYPELESGGTIEGVVVSYKDEQDKELYEVLKRMPDLEDVGGGMGREQSRSFKGEQAVMSAIVHLQEGKKKAVIYATQGNGELDLNDQNRQALDRGLGQLKQDFERAKLPYELKELRLERTPGERTPPRVPDDAFALLVAGPDPITDPKKIEPLREYMKRPKAKMMLFLDVERDREGQIQATGFEEFLAEFGVRLSKDIIINARHDALILSEVEIASQADKQIQDTLGTMRPFGLIEARTVRPAEGSNYSTKAFLETRRVPSGPHGQWAEENLRGTAQQIAEYVEQLYEKRRNEFNTKVNGQPVPVAVTVRDKSAQAPDPSDPHAFMREDKGEPRLVVFGDSTMISNVGLGQGAYRGHYFITFQNAIAWLRGRPELLSTIQPVRRDDYRLQLTEEQSSRLRWFSGPALLLIIIVGGTGVWLMRRR